MAARKAQKEKQALLVRAAAYTGHALVEALPERNAVCSLYFQNPTSKVVKSEGAKAKELEADIASKEDRYKLTAQYVENLTRFIPELINHMISTRIMQQHKITFSSARHLVRNIY